MDRKSILLGFCLVALAVSAAAQTTVTSSGTTATTGNVPYVSSATTTSTTVSPSPITVSGSNVGIGTTSPVDKLDVWGGSVGIPYGSGINVISGLTYPTLLLTGWNGSADYLSLYAPGNNNGGRPAITALSSGGVGIGTTNPDATLDVNGTFEISSPLYDNVIYGWANDANNFAIEAHNAANTVKKNIVVNAWGGNVGIGTTSPGATLEVNGNVKLTSGSGASITFQDGTVQSSAYTGVLPGGDYADSVDVTGDRSKYEAGDLLVIDPAHPGKFLKSAEPYSTSVAGIFSTKPGTVGRRQLTPKSPDEVPMAMVGIVPTKVTAENGPIHPGDLLVTSSTLGYAMKGTDRNRMLGAVVGKALGSLDSGTGVVEAVVTLQ